MDSDLTQFLSEMEKTKDAWATKAFNMVRDAARSIVEKDEGIEEFVMAMGGYIWVGKKGGIYDGHEFTDDEWESDRIRMDSAGHLPYDFDSNFAYMVNKLEDEICVLGNSIRIKKGMQPVYDWGDTVKNPIQWKKK